MAKTTPHPYVPSPGPLVQTFTQFKKAMPATIDAGTLKKLSLAPNNESMVLSVFRFLKLVDDEGKKTQTAVSVFKQHGDAAFGKALEAVVKKSYADLFDHYGDDAWSSDRDSLIAYFRGTDETSAITGKRQAVAFETLAALSGHGEIAQPKASGKKPARKSTKKGSSAKSKPGKEKENDVDGGVITSQGENDIGLTVRIEINLPAQGDQDTYDRIFQSIKKNLLNG